MLIPGVLILIMNFLPIRSYDNYITANLELALLKQAGINCYIKDEYTITIDPLLSPALGGMKLMVEENSAEEAKAILDASDRQYLQSIPCPICNDTSLEMITTIIHYTTWTGRIKSLLINGQEKEVKRFYRCNHCFHEFKELT